MYQAECAPKQIRGMVVSAFQFFVTVGLLIAAVIVNATKDRMNASSYQIPIGVQFIWGMIIAVGVVFLPESPRWLMMKDKNDRARRSLSRLLGQPEDSVEVSQEYATIAANLEHERKNGRASWADCFRTGESKALQRTATGMAIQALQQLTGINFICTSQSYFQSRRLISQSTTEPLSSKIVESPTHSSSPSRPTSSTRSARLSECTQRTRSVDDL